MSTDSNFDVLANTYDADFTYSIIGSLQRKSVRKWTAKQLMGKQELDILEINCGTGEDALWLASKGHRVMASDISKEMVAAAEQKAIQEQVKINLFVCSFSDLASKLEGKKFDIIFSNFGGLNCANRQELIQLNSDFDSFLKPKGLLIMILLGKKCLIEKLYFLLRFDFKKINRRKQEVSAYLSSDNFIRTWYYTHQEVAKIFGLFSIKEKKPIGLFVPPSYLEPIVKKNKLFLPIVKLMETLFSRIGLLANYGDHILITLEKK